MKPTTSLPFRYDENYAVLQHRRLTGHSSLGKRLDEARQLLGTAQGDAVVVASAYASHAPVTLKAREALGCGFLQERLLCLIRVPTLMTACQLASTCRDLGVNAPW